MSKRNPKQIFVYCSEGIQAEVRKIQAEHGLPSFSAALRAVLRFGITTMKDTEKLGRSDLYMSFIDREKTD